MASAATGVGLPLHGLRVVDMADVRGETCGRFLADLGAEASGVEPPGGAVSRTLPPSHGAGSLFFATRNSNKLGVTVDLETSAGRAELLDVLREADFWIESTAPGTLESLGLPVSAALEANPRLIAVSITDFGQWGTYRDWQATDWVQVAMSGVLSRSGLPGLPPLVPPGGMAYETTAIQAAWAALCRTGTRCARDAATTSTSRCTRRRDRSWIPSSAPRR